MQTLNQIASTSFYNVTCKVCAFVRDAVKSFFVKLIEMGEVAGRARAARELAAMGRMDDAKRIMLDGAKKDA